MSVGVQIPISCANPSIHCEDLNLGPHTCVASTLPTESSPPAQEVSHLHNANKDRPKH